MIYTTTDRIARKLRARLSLYENSQPIAYPTTVVTQGVDPELIEIVGEEKENFVNLILKQIYVLPLSKQHEILADVVEGLVIADLLKVHFQGQQNPANDYAVEVRNNAMQLLYLLTAGYNIYIPNIPVQQAMPGLIPPRKIVLDGEAIRVTSPEQVIMNNEMFVITPDKSKITNEFEAVNYNKPNPQYNIFN